MSHNLEEAMEAVVAGAAAEGGAPADHPVLFRGTQMLLGLFLCGI